MWFGKSLGRRRKMRDSLTRGKLQKATRHLRGRLLKLEPLEERMLLAVDTAFDLVSSTLSITESGAGQADSVILGYDTTVSGIYVYDPAGITPDLLANVVDAFTVWYASVAQVDVDLGNFADALTVDISGSLIPPAITGGLIPVPIQYDGGAGFDRLTLTDPGGAHASEMLALGAAPGSGRSTIGVQVVDFQNIEPFASVVPAATFSITSAPGIASLLQGENQINYTDSPANPGTHGLVTVDSFEPIEFSNKTNLVIDAGAGSDEINLNNPATPTGLTGITVKGGDATGSDTVIVNGTTGQDTIAMTYTITVPTAPNTDEATISGAQPVPVEVDTAELVIINGRGGDDALTVTTPAGVNTVTYTPGDTRDSAGLLTDGLLPMRFTGLGTGVGASVTLDDPAVARLDTLVYNGTPVSDVFNLAATSGAVTLVGTPGPYLTLNTPGVDDVRLNGLAGDDTFNISAPQPYATILVNGGEPDASDVLNLTDTDGDDWIEPYLYSHPLPPAAEVQGFPVPVTVNGLGGEIGIVGVEHVNIDASAGGANSIRVHDEAEGSLTYTPTGEFEGTFQHEGLNTVFTFSNLTQSFNVWSVADRVDEVILRGTEGSDVIKIDAALHVATVVASGTGWKPLLMNFGIEVLTALGRKGNDTFRVVPGPGVSGSLENLRIYVDGGDPGASDALVISGTASAPLADTDFVVVNRGRNPDEGTVRVFRDGTGVVGDETSPGPFTAPTQFPDIAYTKTEIVAPNVFVDANGNPNLLILGPDPFEPNEFRANAAPVGTGRTLNVEHLAVFPNAAEHPGVPADQDWMRVVAEVTGTLDFQVYFRQFNSELFPGGGDLSIEVRDADGTVIAGTGAFGTNDATDDERVRIPAVAGQTYYLRVFGAEDTVTNGYDLTVVNTPAPVPYDLELQDTPVGDPPPANSDTGRSQLDNVTRDATPTIFLRLDDGSLRYDLPGNDPGAGGFPNNPPDESIPIPFQTTFLPGFRVAIFDEGPTPSQPATNPQIPVGYAAEVAGSPGLYTFTFPADLSDGSHFISARVEIIDPSDPDNDAGTADHWSGFGQRSLSMEIVVDTDEPPASFGDPATADDGLAPDSDTGVLPPNPDTVIDRFLSDMTPRFWGRAEADATMRLYADANGNGTLEVGTDVFLGQATAIPLDGTNQAPEGYWEIESVVNLNNPDFFPTLDGSRTVFLTAEDPAGNGNTPSEAADVLEIFLDTQGPVIDEAFVTDEPDYDLFNPKGPDGTARPTPLVERLTIRFVDLPERLPPDFTYDALKQDVAEERGHYLLVGDANGVIAIEEVIVTQSVGLDNVARATVELVFFEPLPDDRFTLTISDSIVDPVGNALDGENNAVEPQSPPQFPTGDGRPGGDFVARLTIDSRAEIGVWAAGSVYVDTNGNFVFDPENPDHTNRDIVYSLGFTSDYVFAGNFAPDGALSADGFHKLAVYGRTAAGFRWLFDTDNDGVADITRPDAAGVIGIPVAGNFRAARPGDEVGVFTGTTWHLDTAGALSLAGATVVPSSLRGYPVVGDFNGDGIDDLGTLNYQAQRFEISLGTGGGWSGALSFTAPLPFAGFIGVRERPVAGDVDGDGIDDLGLWVPDRGGMTPAEGAEWYFYVSAGRSLADRLAGSENPGQLEFEPLPFGHDLFARFGDQFGVPVVGNFDPPVTGTGEVPDAVSAGDPENVEDTIAGKEEAGNSPTAAPVKLVGTAGDDVFRFMPGHAPDTWVVATGGVRQQIVGNPVAVDFDGLGGHDTAIFIGTTGDEVAELWSGRGVFTGKGFVVTADSAESITVIAGGGNDTAHLYDSEGNDRFRAGPDWAKLKGEGFLIRALDFPTVRAYATQGGVDVARLFDSPGNDRFEATPEYGRLYGNGFDNRAESFRYTHGYARNGGDDTANLYDSEGDDRFRATPDWAKLYGDGFYTRAVAFPTVYASATRGGIDVARLFDSALDDYLEAGEDWVRLFNEDPQLAFSIAAAGFESVKASSSGQNDLKDVDPNALDWLVAKGWQ